ncbi:hypothetical protein ACFY5D_21930 [Paeniglutamicibacter sp. NPDC012692]|uniref:hypothetical protein n=1 Tax=Paeniglutamicibacter sp. NPDC012692 TaxID=3364388 RepID=UPI0036AE4156
MKTTPPLTATPELASLLAGRGWLRATELNTPDCTVWDYAPSLPEQQTPEQKVAPTTIFIDHTGDSEFCFVEPATRTTLWNTYSRNFGCPEDLIRWLPVIENWRAPRSHEHESPLGFARLRARGLISNSEMMETLEHFPHVPVDTDGYVPSLSGTIGELHQAYRAKLLSKKEFKVLMAASRHADLLH